jgi:hypothetical protein
MDFAGRNILPAYAGNGKGSIALHPERACILDFRRKV